MHQDNDVPLTLAEARALIDRAVEKTRQLHLHGAFVVVDVGGHVISISRMEGAPATSVPVSRAKAFLSAITHEPTTSFAARLRNAPELMESYREFFPASTFPGQGGMPIKKGGTTVGGFGTGPGIGPKTHVDGVDPNAFLIDGQKGNAEDIVVAYALQVPYEDQHPPRG